SRSATSQAVICTRVPDCSSSAWRLAAPSASGPRRGAGIRGRMTGWAGGGRCAGGAGAAGDQDGARGVECGGGGLAGGAGQAGDPYLPVVYGELLFAGLGGAGPHGPERLDAGVALREDDAVGVLGLRGAAQAPYGGGRRVCLGRAGGDDEAAVAGGRPGGGGPGDPPDTAQRGGGGGPE